MKSLPVIRHDHGHGHTSSDSNSCANRLRPRKGRRKWQWLLTATAPTAFIAIILLSLSAPTQARSLRIRSEADSYSDGEDGSGNSATHFNYTATRYRIGNETLTYQISTFLAQEEAKCLEEFGGQENKTGGADPYEVYNPFICTHREPGTIPGGQDPCETCRSLTTSLRKSREECRTFCETSSFCFQRCEAIRARSRVWLQKQEQGQDSEAEIKTTETKERSWNNESFFLEEPKVFCEDVVALEETAPSGHGSTGNGDAFPLPYALLGRRTGNGNEEAYSPFVNYDSSSSTSSSSSPGTHFIYLKWKLMRRSSNSNTNSQAKSRASTKNKNAAKKQSLHTGAVGGTDAISEIPFPIVYLLEYQTPDLGDWILLGKRFTTVERITVPYHSQEFRWRITAVGAQGIIHRAYSNQLYQTLDGFQEPGPPSRIYVTREIVSDATSVDVLIGWEPPPEKPCAYKINLYPMDTMDHYRTHRLTEPLGVNLHLLKGLKFGAKYDVTMTSRGDNWRFESTLKSQNFTTMTCLEAHNHRFDMCDPPPPRNITHELISIPETQTTTTQGTAEDQKKGKLNVKLSWFPPLYTSPTNPISSYSVSFGPPLNESQAGNNKNILSAAFFRMNRNHIVPGNTTHIFLNELLQNTQYVIKMTAISVKGKSQPIQYHLSTKLGGNSEIIMQQTSNWLYISISISCLILTLFACHFIRVLVRKRKVKKARNQYFQTMEDRDVISADWSIVPLNDECYSLKMLGEFSKEKWEISYDKLVMGDVIGQGAFGVVRRAQMARKNFLALGKKPFDNANVDPEKLETVAVKMLKVSATRDDRDQLIKEILTMQNLGPHPQIVGLLGACTKGRGLCLVMEFCPGGDLLTFLRKVRAKYWPTLGMVDSVKNTAENSRSRPQQTSTRTSTSSHRKSTDSSPITYADLEVLSDYSSSPDKTAGSANGTLHEYGNAPPGIPPARRPPSPPGVDFDDECRPIDEKDVLCYARQIAMGMEYLEKNHIVHRDLACRNVLLLGDYKQVKLSDFGLSRDVYTWNVYHQKSNGKLPIKWMSIESIFTHVFTSKSDVWSYGILLWELVTLGGTPYPGLGNTELFQVLKSGYRMERPDNCSEELYALMKKCWRTAPGSRPNFTELRRYVETMMEAAEPSLYLSLMADLPTDYFHINRDDLLHTTLEEELSGSKENLSLMSASNSNSNLKRMSHSTSKRSLRHHVHRDRDHETAHKTSSTTSSSNGNNNNNDENEKSGSSTSACCAPHSSSTSIPNSSQNQRENAYGYGGGRSKIPRSTSNDVISTIKTDSIAECASSGGRGSSSNVCGSSTSTETATTDSPDSRLLMHSSSVKHSRHRISFPLLNNEEAISAESHSTIDKHERTEGIFKKQLKTEGDEKQGQHAPEVVPTSLYSHINGESCRLPSLSQSDRPRDHDESRQLSAEEALKEEEDEDEEPEVGGDDDVHQSLIKSTSKTFQSEPPSHKTTFRLQSSQDINNSHNITNTTATTAHHNCNGIRRPSSGGSRGDSPSAPSPPPRSPTTISNAFKEVNNVTIIENRTYDLV